MTARQQFVSGIADANVRVDHYLVRQLPATLSRAAIQRAIEQGAVTVQGRPVRANRRLRPGEAIEIDADCLVTPASSTWKPEPIPLAVVYEDDELLVINKPPGLVTHPAPGHWSGTLVNAVLWHLQQRPAAAALPRAGIVHRLDKDTSGLLVVAKTDLALRALSGQLKSRTLGRTYLALVEGHVEFDEGTIDAPIGRHPTHRKEMTVRPTGGREAVTRYRVLHRLQRAERPEPGGSALRVRYTVLAVALQTGRTHQIRVHLAHRGHPVVGDTVYGRHPIEFWTRFGVERQLLHAWRIHFVHPLTQRTISCTAPLPAEMQDWAPDVDGAAAAF